MKKNRNTHKQIYIYSHMQCEVSTCTIDPPLAPLNTEKAAISAVYAMKKVIKQPSNA